MLRHDLGLQVALESCWGVKMGLYWAGATPRPRWGVVLRGSFSARIIPPRLAGSPSSSVSSGSSESFHRERERSARTPLPPPAPMPVPGPMHPVPRTPMMDARRYRSLFPRRQVAPPTPPSSPTPPLSDDEPSVERIDTEAELEGDPEEPYLVGDAYLGGREVYSSDASYGSEHESANVRSGPSSRHSSGSSSGSGSVGYGFVTSGSANDASSNDDLVNRHFIGTFP
ncbi:hypothetical protein PIB30_059837 [Stylosanthes scabra]|uniref:Uncharacterized protein n=1 Tax=Stylosanthes scabra TaxID=79078 RepID=A0ABU6WM21_9FABA|nr:hypothetical protein [Stylosanthes scabra]